MKKLFLSVLVCYLCVNSFAQIDTSKKANPANPDKWEIIKGNGKSSMGKLFVNLPKGTEWSMTIYAAGTNKVLSNTILKTSFSLVPGTYDLEINQIWLKGVPVEKGNSTRLKAGVLHITTPNSWTLYDEGKKKVLINAYSKQQRGLPVGKYILSITGQDQHIEINDEFPGPVNPGAIAIESPYYEITPLNPSTASMGKLSIRVPKDTTIYVPPYVTIPLLIRDTVKIRMSSTSYMIFKLPKYLTAKTYHISLNGFKFTVPVKAGKETRLKAGFLIITKKETEGNDGGEGAIGNAFDQIYGSNDFPDLTWEWKLTGGGVNYSGKKRTIIALPPGEYNLRRFEPTGTGDHFDYKVIIKDGEWTKNGVRQ